MKLTHWLQAAAFLLLTGILRVMPLRFARLIGRSFGSVGYHLLASRRRVTLTNLAHAYPEIDEQHRVRIAKDSFRSVGEASMEIGWLSRLTRDVLRDHVTLSNPEVLDEGLKAGTGIVVVVSHYAGWELILQGIQQYAPGRTHVVYKPLSNRMVDAIVLSWRSRLGLKWIPLERAVEDTMGAVKSGDVVILAADQSVGPESVWTSFFGRDVPTAKGPAALCLKTGAVLYLSAVRRQKDGTCSGPLVRVKTKDLHGYNDVNMRKLTQRLTSLTEEYIRKDPGQWMWTHKRWKHSKEESGS